MSSTNSNASYINKREKLCGICEEPLDGPCSKCKGNNHSGCATVRGRCGDAFHEHCIDEWLKFCDVCPWCNKEFEFT
ncbi:hypothetical protein TVAG_148930 [Trichomonas vaginalis G3]|uniref:RING-type domain-containing protein n=1 Tax=Trichomonas vaginalis (strain ATCC PRA-98 / G3) TaxID=412133 RepID=A2FEN8_TRIV3|nr:RING/U-box family [Trichomonas vaginalis G3]EAX96618.1 hypothetical protein TVAG_148930 [Trichomonas vaginalis G3]KAI5532907.1 RING/U-box family [Trichomonas vaginalis G3]|eukprot:XP_001309548.1 hypothetical protein [Trichomonas vaginalis G3]